MLINSYATLLELKNYMTPRGLISSNITTDSSDDAIMESMLQGISRWIDDQTHRTFYPRIETRLYDYPTEDVLFLDDDLLSLTTLTNGDTTVITPAQYALYPKNAQPKEWIKIIPSSSIWWAATAAGDYESAISVLGLWGFHNQFLQRGWSSAGTLGAAITDTTGLSLTMTTGHTVLQGELYKIDNEIVNVAGVSTNAVTLASRGDNGSTAATHLNGATVYKWNCQPEIKSALLSIAQSVYSSRDGQSSQGNVTVTQAGVVIRPGDVSGMTQRTISAFTRPL